MSGEEGGGLSGDWGANFVMVEFVGGPLDGTQPVHPAQNYYLRVPENTEGVYIYRFIDGRGYYEWTSC